MGSVPRSGKNKTRTSGQSRTSTEFKVGSVHVYLRGKVWYVRYHERGKRRQQRVSQSKVEAKRIAAEINAHLEFQLPTTFGFEPISLVELRFKWLAFHEDIKRSSLATIDRYRSATAHLMVYADEAAIKQPLEFSTSVTEEFVRFLRKSKIAPNGHENTKKRPLRDAGVKFILNTCSTLMNYAKRQRHLPPYFENPFATLGIGHIPVEDAKQTLVFTGEEERALLKTADQWLFPIMLTLLQSGMRPRELTHLLLPDDLDLVDGWIHIRNKQHLGWMVKTRRERSIPITPELVGVLRFVVADRIGGPVFLQRRCLNGFVPALENCSRNQIEVELIRRADGFQVASISQSTRIARRQAAKTIWRDLGAVKYDYLRHQFISLMKNIDRPDITAVKTCRHNFATGLQDANVDPLIRNELLGHSPTGLGMTTRYTQTRPETKKRQLLTALKDSASSEIARERLADLSICTVNKFGSAMFNGGDDR